MSARRSIWIWWGTGALLLLGIAGWVYRASLKERSQARSAFDSQLLDPAIEASRQPLPEGTKENRMPPPAGIDPGVQRALQTINEVNRINQINAELRRKSATASPTPKKSK